MQPKDALVFSLPLRHLTFFSLSFSSLSFSTNSPSLTSASIQLSFLLPSLISLCLPLSPSSLLPPSPPHLSFPLSILFSLLPHSLLSGCLSSDSIDPLHDLHQCSTGGGGWQQEWSRLLVHFPAPAEDVLSTLQRTEPRSSSCDCTPGKGNTSSGHKEWSLPCVCDT